MGRAREPSGAAARGNVSGYCSALDFFVFHPPGDQCKWAQPVMNEGEMAVASDYSDGRRGANGSDAPLTVPQVAVHARIWAIDAHRMITQKTAGVRANGYLG